MNVLSLLVQGSIGDKFYLIIARKWWMINEDSRVL